MSLRDYYARPSWDFESPLEYEMYKARMDMEARADVSFRPKSERELYMEEIRGLEVKLSQEAQKTLEANKKITTLNERIKYLEDAILEVEGDKNA